MLLFPQLPSFIADDICSNYVDKTIENLKSLREISHDMITYTATGGNKVSPEKLVEVQQTISIIAENNGYPRINVLQQQYRNFDAELAKYMLAKTALVAALEKLESPLAEGSSSELELLCCAAAWPLLSMLAHQMVVALLRSAAAANARP